MISCLFLLVSGSLVAAEQSVKLLLPGMDCPVCPITIKKSLLNVAGVKSVDIVYSTKTATIVFDDKHAAINLLIEATNNVGYPSFVGEEQ